MRQVNHQRVDCHRSQLAAAFHASALLPKADIVVRADHVRFVPLADLYSLIIRSVLVAPAGQRRETK